MINAVIIDDERLARQELKRLLEVHSDIDIVSEFGDADEAIDYLKDNQPSSHPVENKQVLAKNLRKRNELLAEVSRQYLIT